MEGNAVIDVPLPGLPLTVVWIAQKYSLGAATPAGVDLLGSEE